MKTITEVLPKIVQWQSIPYSAGLNCKCGKCDLAYVCFDHSNKYIKAIAVGWCDTDYGFMGVFECPECHSKFRCHCGNHDKFDLSDFEEGFRNFLLASTENGPDIIDELEEEN